MSKLVTIYLLLFLSCLFSSVSEADHRLKLNPFTAKASLIRYWNNRISNNIPKPSFLLSKASPLSALDTVTFTNLLSKHTLKTRLPSFCKNANLFCDFDPIFLQTHPSPHHSDANFTSYNSEQFSNYGASKLSGVDTFNSYSSNINIPLNSFSRYSPASTGHSESFATYSNNSNIGNDTFSNYGTSANGGQGDFTSYESNVNVPDMKFTSYSLNGNHHKLSFGSYSADTNSGTEVFTAYGKNGNGVPSEFNNYGKNSNIVGSTFASYGELANGANDSFTSYSPSANNAHNVFKNYGSKVTSGVESFVNYRDQSNVGDDNFQNYLRDSSSTKASFFNYGKSFNQGIDRFKNYGTGSVNRKVDFKGYGVNNSFKGYDDKKGVTFSGYNKNDGKKSNNKFTVVNNLIEEGKFFRESMLKEGNVMKMPDIKDKMPRRSFLPRSISSKLPFSTKSFTELQEIFEAKQNSTLERVMKNALGECERPASQGETKRCVASIEDMIDFAISVLGENVVVRSTENVNGSGQKVLIGSVKGINGGQVTKSVSCHQSLLPYLLYYCHYVPKVRVYEAEIMDLQTKGMINKGIAICHIDTSSWSPGHGAFLALGSRPGRIEVCHWIFENDMTWAIAD